MTLAILFKLYNLECNFQIFFKKISSFRRWLLALAYSGDCRFKNAHRPALTIHLNTLRSSGGPGRIRTCNPRIWSPMLCPVRATDPATQHFCAPAVVACVSCDVQSRSRFRSDLSFLVHRMTTATRAKLFNGKFLSLALLILTRRVIAPFAAIAR